MKHIHAELIHEWADGVQIQCRLSEKSKWEDTENPSWNKEFEYRIKPKPKPDVVRYYEINKEFGGLSQMPYYNLKATYDGETGELKSAEVLK